MLIGIVAHTSRAQAAHQLMADTHAAYMNIDNGKLGCNLNHRKVWQWLLDHAADHEWLVVLEDDAKVHSDFRDQLTQALAVAPTPLVSLYMGTGHPKRRQPAMHDSIAIAKHYNASWILHNETMHAVALAIRTDHVASMLDHTHNTRSPIDKAISNWAKHNDKLQTAYTAPSLCDHTDGPTTTTHARTGSHPRTAWWHDSRAQWTTATINLDTYTHVDTVNGPHCSDADAS